MSKKLASQIFHLVIGACLGATVTCFLLAYVFAKTTLSYHGTLFADRYVHVTPTSFSSSPARHTRYDASRLAAE